MTDISQAKNQAILSPVPSLWLMAFVGFSLVYIFLPNLLPSAWLWFFKIIPIALLLQLALSRTGGRARTL